jgi:hypothetical protein
MIKQYQNLKCFLHWVWLVCLLLAGCSSSAPENEALEQPQSTATPIFALVPTTSPAGIPMDPDSTAPAFTPLTNADDATIPPAVPVSPAALTPTPTPEDIQSSTSITTTASHQIFLPLMLHAVTEMDTLAEPTEDERIAEIIIYDEELAPNWTAEQSRGITYDMATTDYVYSGAVATAITPTKTYGQFFLTLNAAPEVAYDRDEIIGVSFWLSGGASLIENDDLAVTVLGSNDYTYWVPDDTSVAEQLEEELTDGLPLFSETRLYFLDINRPIPPNTWVEVIVWLNERIYDPPYNYITGIYLKNDADFLQTYYIDRVSFLVDQQ